MGEEESGQFVDRALGNLCIYSIKAVEACELANGGWTFLCYVQLCKQMKP